MSKGTIVVNRGIRTYHLVNGPNGETRTLPPGGSIELLDEKEAKHMLRYHDIKDIKDAAPQASQRIQDLEKQLAAAKAENENLMNAHKKAAKSGEQSIEEQNAESAGTGFAGPGPVVPAPGRPAPETEPTHQPVPGFPESDEGDKKRHHKKGR